jgi:tetratricopeptide (TPR) repeat protein
VFVQIKYLKYFLIISFFILFLGCDSIKHSFAGRFFFNITARYNIYFNAKEQFRQVRLQTEENHIDNYNSILDIHRFSDESNAKSNNSALDYVSEKCIKLIEKKELSKWVDDSYFLIAKSYFYKHDFFAAIETFQYVNTKYKGSRLAYESMIWIILANIQLERFEEAQAIVTFVKSQEGFPEYLKKELLLAEASVSIKMKDYVTATVLLEKALKLEKKRYNKTRYLFILAQLYQERKELNLASGLYADVIKRNPPYEMAFNSKMNLSRCIDVKSEKEARYVINKLSKMLRDDKNIDYYDQIYFELALIYFKINMPDEAAQYLQKAILHSKGNDNQKALSYLALADYYYDNALFRPAKTYYDSAAVFLNSNYPDYENIIERNKLISKLLENLLTIETEDSLLYLASLPQKSLDSTINIVYQAELKARQEEQLKEKEKQLREQQEQQYNAQVLRENRQFGPTPGGGSWYFYNRAAMDLGKSEFKVKWGERPLTDHWRRKNRSASISFDEEEDTGADDGEEMADTLILSEEEEKLLSEKIQTIPKALQKFYKDIPFTQTQKKISETRMIQAYKNAGDIYANELYEYDKAIETYEKLLEKFPDNIYHLEVHYALYKLYKLKNNETQMEKHKSYILNNYPDSDYATMIRNPDQFQRLSTERNAELDKYYETSYQYFKEANCEEVEKRRIQARIQFPKNYNESKFEYLSILCKGKTAPAEEFETLLRNFIKKYNDEVANHAQSVLDYLLKEKETETRQKEKEDIESFLSNTSYTFNENEKHYFFYVFSASGNANTLKISFSDYNSTYFKLLKLRVSDFLLNTEKQIILIKEFNGKREADQYLQTMLRDDKFLDSIQNTSPEFYIISGSNFNILLGEKDLKPYSAFYQRYYK